MDQNILFHQTILESWNVICCCWYCFVFILLPIFHSYPCKSHPKPGSISQCSYKMQYNESIYILIIILSVLQEKIFIIWLLIITQKQTANSKRHQLEKPIQFWCFHVFSYATTDIIRIWFWFEYSCEFWKLEWQFKYFERFSPKCIDIKRWLKK